MPAHRIEPGVPGQPVDQNLRPTDSILRVGLMRPSGAQLALSPLRNSSPGKMDACRYRNTQGLTPCPKRSQAQRLVFDRSKGLPVPFIGGYAPRNPGEGFPWRGTTGDLHFSGLHALLQEASERSPHGLARNGKEADGGRLEGDTVPTERLRYNRLLARNHHGNRDVLRLHMERGIHGLPT